MAKKADQIPENELPENELPTKEPKRVEQDDIDVTKQKVRVHLDRARPGEETEIWVSNGRENVLVKKGVDVDVPYWVWLRLMQREDAEKVAYDYETASAKRAESI